MKNIKLFDDSIIQGEIGWDNVNFKWLLPSNIKEVEFEDGTIIENPNYEAPND